MQLLSLLVSIKRQLSAFPKQVFESARGLNAAYMEGRICETGRF